jgi:sugar fermentation stimulation protein A
MKFPNPLIKGRLVQRYKRFLADVELASGEIITAHCANPGAMLGLKDPGLTVWLSPATNPKRKLKYSWELLEVDGGLVGINTSLPNKIVEEAIEAGKIAELLGYPTLRREVKYGKNSRIDILLEGGDAPCYVEVKNVHLRRNGSHAEFPDSVTTRGAKHLEELGDVAEAGGRAVMFYLIQRTDCDHFSIAGDIDPKYAEGLKRARERGVETLCYDCQISVERIVVGAPVPLQVSG